jgi:hypothetical protein
MFRRDVLAVYHQATEHLFLTTTNDQPEKQKSETGSQKSEVRARVMDQEKRPSDPSPLR